MERRSVNDEEPGWHRVDTGMVRSLPNRGEGDCLFRALSHQLEGEYLAPQLREMAVNYMAAHLDDFMAQLIVLGEDMLASGELPMAAVANDGGLGLPQHVLNTLRYPWTWGGAECIAALANDLHRRILVYLEDGAPIVFEPLIAQGPMLRILHRFGGGERRTHYESVLQWQPAAQEDQGVAAQVPGAADAEHDPPAGHDSAALPPLPAGEVNRPASPPLKKLRRSARLVSPSTYSSFRVEIFSEPEDCPRDVPVRIAKYRRCLICDNRVGKYTLLCGCFPVCGLCIMQWFIKNSNNCTRCQGQVLGWFKVYNQN